MEEFIHLDLEKCLVNTENPKSIRLLANNKKSIAAIGKRGPQGFGYSSARSGYITVGAMATGVAHALDRIIIDKVVNSYAVANEALGVSCAPAFADLNFDLKNDKNVPFYAQGKFSEERGSDSIDLVIQCADKTISKILNVSTAEDLTNHLFSNSYELLVPVVLYALSDEVKDFVPSSDELKELFTKIATDYYTDGREVSDTDVLKFCDSFLYGFVKKYPNLYVQYSKYNVSSLIKMSTTHAPFLEFNTTVEPYFSGQKSTLFTDEIVNKVFAVKSKNGKRSFSKRYQDCIDGVFAIDFKWSEAQELRIPSSSTLENFIPTEQFYSLMTKFTNKIDKLLPRMKNNNDNNLDIIQSDYINAFLAGKPGTGKTTLAYALGAALHMPVYTIPITKNTEEDTFQGMTKVVDGGFKFVATDFLDAYQNGGIVILEEVNLADPSVIMGSLGQAVEPPFILMKDGYQPVRRHPLCFIIGTMNIGTYGSKGISQAFSSRFKQTYILNDPKKEEFIAILSKQGHSIKACEWVYKAYTRICEYLSRPENPREEICLNVTLRSCLGALECIEEGDTPLQAIAHTMVGKIAEEDLELAEEVRNGVLQSLENANF